MAVMLAEILLSAVKEQVLYKFQPSIELYIYYIDDILIIWKDDQNIENITNALTLEQ